MAFSDGKCLLVSCFLFLMTPSKSNGARISNLEREVFSLNKQIDQLVEVVVESM